MAAQSGKSDRDWSTFEVLLVDDDDYFLGFMKRQLEVLGVTRIREASNGAKGLFALHQPSHPDVIICDLQMPTMNGLEFLRQLWLERFAGGILLVSGEKRHVLGAAEALVQAYGLKLLRAASKPLTLEALSEALDTLVSVHESPTNAEAPDAQQSSADLAMALRDRDLKLHYQPKVSLTDGRLLGVEALLRSEAGLDTAALVQAACDQGLTKRLTSFVLETAVPELSELLVRHPELTLSVNIFPDDLLNPDLPSVLSAHADVAGVPRERLILEVPELPGHAAAKRLLEVVGQLSLRGISLALDGQGVGYAEMERLVQCSFAEIKLDRAFVRGAYARSHAGEILEQFTALARRLGLRVVAEGVETRADWDFVALAGCDQAQGYYVAPAMPGPGMVYWADWYSSRDLLCDEH